MSTVAAANSGVAGPGRRTPAVALVGRPNVGKSTLFNRLCGGRSALVADYAGLTRDRRYGRAAIEGRIVSLIDTGGLGEAGLAGDDMAAAVAVQARQAIDEADLVVMLADARAGLAPADEDIAADLRRRGVPARIAVNKIDGVDPSAAHEFWRLGLDEPLAISAAHGRGVAHLKAVIAAALPEAAGEDAQGASAAIRVAVIGRPNVGKSTLVNRLLGAERQVVLDRPGTTRDAIEIPFGDYLLIDTAGLRRRGRVSEVVEKFSIVKALDALERAHVALLLLDAREGLVDQDLQLLRHAAEAGTGVLLLVNKWDGLTPERRAQVRIGIDRRLDFAPWVSVRYISALTGAGVGKLMAAVDAIHRAGAFDVGTPQLNRILDQATRAHPPPAVRGRPIKLRYAHKTGAHPPAVMLHGNRTDLLPGSYLRYLENRFRAALDLAGTPLHISTRTGENPWAGRNELSPRQINRRKRLIRHRLSRKGR